MSQQLKKSLSKPGALLFDLDGTLVDTARDLGAALNFVLRQHGLPEKSFEEYRPAASHGAKGLLQLGFGAAIKDIDFGKARQSLLDYYHQHSGVHSDLFDGAEALFSALKQRDIPWAIVTNKPYKLAARVQRQLPALLQSRLLIGGDSLAQRKPDPIPLWMAAHSMQVRARDCWYIGDAQRDIEAGIRAGMSTVMADFGYIGPEDQPELWGADLHIARLTDLIHYLG
jgi:2-phosphoglycolate phosphatase